MDESGDEGFRFKDGSSKWFVLSAVILPRAVELSEVKLVDEVREAINTNREPKHRIQGKKPLHFRDLKHDARKFYAGRIGRANLRSISICIHKPDLISPEKFQLDFRLYFYATRLLAERISWYCRDHHRKNDPGDGSVEIVFSNRGHVDYSALCEYLTKLEGNAVAFDYRADLKVIRPNQVLTMSSGRRMGLQIADAVASSTFFALEPNSYGQVEDAYLRAIAPTFYRHQGDPWGYGIKIMPREAEEQRRRGELIVPLA